MKFDPNKQKFYILDSYFYNFLDDGSISEKEMHRSLIKTFFSLGLILMPIHTPGHWTLVVIFPEEKKVVHYDSLKKSGIGKGINSNIKKYLEQYIFEKPATPNRRTTNNWIFLLSGDNVPQQNNGCDCGVYVCSNAVNIITQQPLSEMELGGKNKLSFREKMIYDIVRQELSEDDNVI